MRHATNLAFSLLGVIPYFRVRSFAFSLLFLFFLAPISPVLSQRVSIGLFDAEDVQRLEIRPVVAGYQLVAGALRRPLATNQVVVASRQGEAVALTVGGQPLGSFPFVAFLHTEVEAQLAIAPESLGAKSAHYDGNLTLSVDFQRLMCINLIDRERYVAGVVLAEVGGGAHDELYKAQSILVRTYLLAHPERHFNEGFNLCDGVHCQAYKGSASEYPRVLAAAEATRGQVLVDANGRLIVSVFHANCGGQTASAESVWLTPRAYLQSVRDPHCVKASGASWRRTLALDTWLRFLSSKGIATSTLRASDLAYRSQRRESLYSLPGGRSVPFRDLREYFGLRSAWFDVEVRGNQVHLAGHGYGHGIGMCQQGAMAKARAGYTHLQILQAYFSGVRIVDCSEALPLEGIDIQ